MRTRCLFSESCYFRIVSFSVQLFDTTKGTQQDESDLICSYMVEWEKLSDKNTFFDIVRRKLGHCSSRNLDTEISLGSVI